MFKSVCFIYLLILVGCDTNQSNESKPVSNNAESFQISTEWYMLTCAGYTFHLYFDAFSNKVKLTSTGEPTCAINPSKTGTYLISKSNSGYKVNLNFNDFSISYSYTIPLSLEPEIADCISEEQAKLVCDQRLFSKEAKDSEVFPNLECRNYLVISALFPDSVSGNSDEQLYSDLKNHCFLDEVYEER